MAFRSASLLRALTVASVFALPSVAMAQQPLSVLVNPLAAPLAVFPSVLPIPNSGDEAFMTNDSAGNPTNTAAAEAAAVGYTPDGLAIIGAPALRAVGPRYVNPATRRVVVLRRGSVVPGFVPTAYSRNLTVAGLVPQGSYDYFISPENKIVFVDPASRRVVRIMR